MCCMSTKFGVDRLGHFPSRARTARQTYTDATDHPNHASATAGIGNKNVLNVNNVLFERNCSLLLHNMNNNSLHTYDSRRVPSYQEDIQSAED